VHYFSRCVAKSFAGALAVARQALERHGFAILAQIDVHKTLKERLRVDARPYVILSACSLKLARDALAADEEVGPMMLLNVAVQERDDRSIEISTVDPATTIGTINHVDVIRAATELRKQLQAVFDEIEASAACDTTLQCVAVRQAAHAGRAA
jgi:uncharacterized protein (DUF302 family)